MKKETTGEWSLVLRPKSGWFDIDLGELWRYRDLLVLFVKRDFAAQYKQTILGPLWFLIQPLLTTIVFTVIFAGVAKIPTDGHPAMLFYLAGTTPWNYFATCLTKTSNTFVANAGLFGKVYFPRLVVPLSIVVSNMVQFSIQFLLFFGFLGYYLLVGAVIHPQYGLILALTPALLLLMALLGMGIGIIVSSLTTKYRDLTHLVSFGVQLLMYGTPVIYSLETLPEKWRWLVALNPMTAPIEVFRSIFLGGSVPWSELGISALITLGVLFSSVIVFHRVEKSFMDTV